MVSRWYQSVDSRKVAKHWILSTIASSSTRPFIYTLELESCSTFTGVFCRDPSLFPTTEELSHCGQKGGFQERLSNGSRNRHAQFKIKCFLMSCCLGDVAVSTLECNMASFWDRSQLYPVYSYNIWSSPATSALPWSWAITWISYSYQDITPVLI